MRIGTPKSDILFASTGEDHFLFGLEGADRVGDVEYLAATNDHYYGNEGKDRLYSYSGDDWLFGNTGADHALIAHHAGKIVFDGGKGRDVANLMGFSEDATVIERDHRTVIRDDDCVVVLRNVEEWL